MVRFSIFGKQQFAGVVFNSLLVICFDFSRMLHESVRWLLSQQRHLEAEEILQKVAIRNKVTLPPTKAFLKMTDGTTGNHINESNVPLTNRTSADDDHNKLTYSKDDTRETQHRKLTVLDLFRTPNLIKNTFILALDW